MEEYINWDKFQSKIQKITGLGYFNSSRTELIARCPFPNCELEQGKSYKYGRLYIHTDSPVFNCFRCNESGSILKLLRYLKLNIDEYINKDHEVFKNMKSGRRVIRLNTSDVNIQNNLSNMELPEFLDRYHNKILYMKNRIGMDIDALKIPNVIFSIREFIQKNNIHLDYNDEMMLDTFDRDYIGFLGNRGTVLILRNTRGLDYHKINLCNPGKMKDFYGMRTSFPDGGHTNKIVLCEGIFDLLVAIKSDSLSELREGSCFWAAVLGSFYRRTLISVLDYIKLSYVDVVVLSDNDKSPYDKIFSSLRNSPMVRNMKVVWNSYGNDFGQLPIHPINMIFNEPKPLNKFRKKYKSNNSFR